MAKKKTFLLESQKYYLTMHKSNQPEQLVEATGLTLDEVKAFLATLPVQTHFFETRKGITAMTGAQSTADDNRRNEAYEEVPSPRGNCVHRF